MDRRLVIAAHADDETIGCGGMIRKRVCRGSAVAVGILTRPRNPSDCLVRKEECEKALNRLGVSEIHFADLDQRPLLFNRRSVDVVRQWIESFNPNTIFMPHENEADSDHSIIAEIVKSALLESQVHAMLLGYEIWTPISNPLFFENISSFIDEKSQAIECYKSQLEQTTYTDMAKALNRYRGEMSGCGRYVEAYTAVRL